MTIHEAHQYEIIEHKMSQLFFKINVTNLIYAMEVKCFKIALYLDFNSRHLTC